MLGAESSLFANYANEEVAYLTMATLWGHMSEIFNLKVIQYENGVVEFRKYNKVINGHLMYISQEEMTERQKIGRENANDDICKPESVFNPFSNSYEEFYTFEQLDMLADRAERSVKSSFNRTVNELYKLTRQCKWEYFITLTYASSVVDRYDFDLCMKKANNWFKNQHKRYAPDLQYIFVPEQHKDGAWHIHGLLARVGTMSFVYSGHIVKDKKIYNLTGWKFGFSTATEVEDVVRVSSYITKYITKDLCACTKGKKRYYRSRNIPEPIESNFLVENGESDNFINEVADSLGVVQTYEKTLSGFIDVNYKYFN